MLQQHLVQQASLAAYQDFILLMGLCVARRAPLVMTLRPQPQNRNPLPITATT